MPKPPIVSGTEAVKALQRLGFHVDRQRGSHVVLNPNSEAGAAEAAGGTGNLPVPAGW